jgi:hypothetical protein
MLIPAAAILPEGPPQWGVRIEVCEFRIARRSHPPGKRWVTNISPESKKRAPWLNEDFL